jgi:hypothetical protein
MFLHEPVSLRLGWVGLVILRWNKREGGLHVIPFLVSAGIDALVEGGIASDVPWPGRGDPRSCGTSERWEAFGRPEQFGAANASGVALPGSRPGNRAQRAPARYALPSVGCTNLVGHDGPISACLLGGVQSLLREQ